jgi:DNA-binding transcriptional LysR family regulator
LILLFLNDYVYFVNFVCFYYDFYFHLTLFRGLLILFSDVFILFFDFTVWENTMDLDRVKEFLVIAEEKSLKRAAEKLHIAPNVLSARYQSFENSLGTKLLIRNAHRTELTSSGRLFLTQAKELVSSYEKILLELKESENTSYRSLKIGICGITISAPDLGYYIYLYNTRHPHTDLELLGDTSYSVAEGLRSGNIDVFVAFGDQNAFGDISGRICIAHISTLCAIVSKDNPLSQKTNITFQELENEQFILYPETAEPCIRKQQIAFLNQSGIHYTAYNSKYDPVFYKLLVSFGKGIILTPVPHPEPPGAEILSITDGGYDTYIYMLYNTDTQNPATLEFVNGFQKFLQEVRKT